MSKRKHETWAYFKTKGEVSSITLSHGEANDHLRILEADPKNTKSIVSYKRDSGKDKIVSSAPTISNSCHFSHQANILSNYTHLYAIDTNTTSYNNMRLSVCSVYFTPELFSRNSKIVKINPLAAFAICNANSEINPEMIGWHILLTHFVDVDYFLNKQQLLGLVTDCALGDHDRINRRRHPYYSDFMLPQNIKLIYGSTDTGKNNLPNAMLSLCDNTASDIIKYIVRNKQDIPTVSNGDNNYDGFFPITSTQAHRIERKHFNKP